MEKQRIKVESRIQEQADLLNPAKEELRAQIDDLAVKIYKVRIEMQSDDEFENPAPGVRQASFEKMLGELESRKSALENELEGLILAQQNIKDIDSDTTISLN